uniref:PBPe domain-containing protein n=1 Tax=Steinernema glaseri TaxID=37863 RepID=A0A1I7YE23_9BILA
MMEQVNLDAAEEPIASPLLKDSSITWTETMWFKFVLVALTVFLTSVIVLYVAEWYVIVKLASATKTEQGYREALGMLYNGERLN